MNRDPVTSSNIVSIGYADGTLEVQFTNGAIWRYSSVPHTEYDALMHADSIGSYFAQNIRNAYTGKPADTQGDAI